MEVQQPSPCQVGYAYLTYYLQKVAKSKMVVDVHEIRAAMGKSRISITLSLIIHQLDPEVDIYLIFPSEYLMKKDMFHYRNHLPPRTVVRHDINFNPGDNAICILDEGDHYVFCETKMFHTLSKNAKSLIVLTAQVSDNDNGCERMLLRGLKYRVFRHKIGMEESFRF